MFANNVVTNHAQCQDFEWEYCVSKKATPSSNFFRIALLTLILPQNTAIDFSGGEVGEDGSVCVVVEEEQERVEQGKEEQCTQQIVDQCYNSYVTTYKDVVKEKCDEVFVKTCRIVLRDRAFNATTRVCKRPLVKQCDDYLPSYSNSYGAPQEPPPEPQIVCRNLYETQCNTTHQVSWYQGETEGLRKQTAGASWWRSISASHQLRPGKIY